MQKRIVALLISLNLMLVFSVSCFAQQQLTFDYQGESYLNWSSLAVEEPLIHNPFVDLDSEQFGLMHKFAGISRLIYAPGFSEQELQKFSEQLDGIRQELKKTNIDADALMEVREEIIQQSIRSSMKSNPLVLDRTWRIAGYMVPLSFNGSKVTEFLLVAMSGACIHTPPPPANQIVLVKYKQGVEFNSLSQAIWVEGKLEASVVTSSDASFYDGNKTVQSVYEVNAVSVGEL